MLKPAKATLKPYERHAVLFMLRHMFFGVVGGFFFGIMLLVLDVGGLRTLIFTSNDMGIALFLLFFGLFITFGSVGMGVGIMTINSQDH
ncbi:conserved hypothetical protein [Rhodospirillaceae bacterium LM-1]|nr:conserved hypothetical protein [Rhodospirillaceae bacterium LM-1]